jgi:hypothetical protein
MKVEKVKPYHSFKSNPDYKNINMIMGMWVILSIVSYLIGGSESLSFMAITIALNVWFAAKLVVCAVCSELERMIKDAK